MCKGYMYSYMYVACGQYLNVTVLDPTVPWPCQVWWRIHSGSRPSAVPVQRFWSQQGWKIQGVSSVHTPVLAMQETKIWLLTSSLSLLGNWREEGGRGWWVVVGIPSGVKAKMCTCISHEWVAKYEKYCSGSKFYNRGKTYTVISVIWPIWAPLHRIGTLNFGDYKH